MHRGAVAWPRALSWMHWRLWVLSSVPLQALRSLMPSLHALGERSKAEHPAELSGLRILSAKGASHLKMSNEVNRRGLTQHHAKARHQAAHLHCSFLPFSASPSTSDGTGSCSAKILLPPPAKPTPLRQHHFSSGVCLQLEGTRLQEKLGDAGSAHQNACAMDGSWHWLCRQQLGA